MNQFFTFMIDWSLKSIVTATFGLAFVLLLRRRSAATRHMVWRATLAAVLLLPLAMVLTPKSGTPTVMEPLQAPVRSAIRPLQISMPTHEIKIASLAAAVARAEAEGTSEEQAFACVYVAGLIAMVGFWIASYFKVRRIANGARRWRDTEDADRILVSGNSELRVPITFGLLRPVILLPREAESWPEPRVQAAILHESAHIVRRDWGWQTASHFVRALQWFNPAVWLIHGALRTSSETATDDEVLMQFGMGPSSYATELLKVAEAAHQNFCSANAMARRGGVASRLRRIVATGVDRTRPQRAFVLGTGFVFSVAGVFVAAGTVAEAAGAEVAGNTAHLLARTPLGASLLSITGRSGSRYVAKLPDGGFVRMVAMTGQQDSDGPVWGPDGKPAGSADRNLLSAILGHHGSSPTPSKRVINFYLQVAKLPMNPGETENGIFRVKSSTGWEYQSGSNTRETDGRLQWDMWSVPASARTCDMDCAISYGAFTAVGQGKLGDGAFHSQVGESREGNTDVTFHLPGKFGDDMAKLECFDADGSLVHGSGEDIWGNDDANGQRFDFFFDTNDLKRIVTYRFSRRVYKHVLIRGIVLPPNPIKP